MVQLKQLNLWNHYGNGEVLLHILLFHIDMYVHVYKFIPEEQQTKWCTYVLAVKRE